MKDRMVELSIFATLSIVIVFAMYALDDSDIISAKKIICEKQQMMSVNIYRMQNDIFCVDPKTNVVYYFGNK